MSACSRPPPPITRIFIFRATIRRPAGWCQQFSLTRLAWKAESGFIVPRQRMMRRRTEGGDDSGSLDLPVMQSLEPYGVLVKAGANEAIKEYIRLLMHWNRRIALTALTDPEEILRFHFGESLFASHAVPIEIG